MNFKFINDQRDSKESQGSNPSRIPVPLISINPMDVYMEPMVIEYDGAVEYVIPNRGTWYNFLRNTVTNQSPILELDGNASIQGDTVLQLNGAGSFTWLIHKHPVELATPPVRYLYSRVRALRLVMEESTDYSLIGFMDNVTFEVSPNGSTWHEIENRAVFTLPSVWDTIYFRISKEDIFLRQYTIRPTMGVNEGYETPLRIDLIR